MYISLAFGFIANVKRIHRLVEYSPIRFLWSTFCIGNISIRFNITICSDYFLDRILNELHLGYGVISNISSVILRCHTAEFSN